MFGESNVGIEMFGSGAISGTLQGGVSGMRYEPGLMRPFIQDNPNSPYRGRPCVRLASGQFKEVPIVHNGQKRIVPRPVFKDYPIQKLQERGIYSPVFNATALRKEEWLKLDEQVLRAARYRLKLWADLVKANSYGGFNAMGTLILEHETMSDPGEAIVDMNGLTEGRGDAPTFQLEGLPLPITHSDFWFDQRWLMASRNKGQSLDIVTGEAAGRRIAECIEKTAIGIQTGITYGGNSTQVGGYGRTSAVYGLVNFPARITKTGLYKPTLLGRSSSGWVPSDTLKDVLSCLDSLRAHKFYGPFNVYHSNDWDQYLDNDYILTGGNVATQTLRQRLEAIKGISSVERLDFLFSSTTDQSAGGPGLENLAQAYPFTMIFVQMTPDVIRAVNGMDITTVQWESVGGMKLNFKVLAIAVPQLRADRYGNCGILTASFTA